LSLVSLAYFAGCATHADQLRGIRQDFYTGDLERAAASLDRQLSRGNGEADVLKLDLAMVHLAGGRPQDAERLLREVRDRFDDFEQFDAGEKALSLVTDDTREAYPGEDYEKILIRAFLALSNLMGDGGDAAAYGLQVADKQQQIIQAAYDREGNNPKLGYKQVALGAYIHGLLREQTHSNYDDVARAYTKVVSWEPGFRSGKQDLERAKHGRHSARGNGVLYVFALVGHGPYKQQVTEEPTSAALMIADGILWASGNQTLPPIVAPVKVPCVVLAANHVDNVQVSVDGQSVGKTETITDVGQLAVQQYEAIYAQVLARAVVRRIVKRGIVHAGKEAADVGKNSWASLAMDVGRLAWEASETADTRCWGLLPDKIQALRLELPAGEHRISLAPARGTSRYGPERGTEVTIADGRNTYVLANFPDRDLVGTILTGP